MCARSPLGILWIGNGALISALLSATPDTVFVCGHVNVDVTADIAC